MNEATRQAEIARKRGLLDLAIRRWSKASAQADRMRRSMDRAQRAFYGFHEVEERADHYWTVQHRLRSELRQLGAGRLA